MPKPSPTSDKLAALAALHERPLTDDVRARIHQSLADKNNLIVAAAAKLAKKHAVSAAIPDVCSAWKRFLENPLKSDKLCHAKLAIIDALDELQHDDQEIFLDATRYQQLEPAYGGAVDTAIKVRIRGAQALVRLGCREIFFVLSDLLMENEPEARLGAAAILSGLDDERSELLLRQRVIAGDARPENCGDYFRALLSLNPRRSLPFVVRYLDDSDTAIVDEAIIALGESRIPEALEHLKRLVAYTTDGERLGVLILAISLLRSDDAADFLLQIVQEQGVKQTMAAIDALRIYRDRADIMTKLKRTVESRHDEKLSSRLTKMLQESA
jgi:HEAT repeat protein